MAKKLKVLIDVDMQDREAVAALEKLQGKLNGVEPASRNASRGMKDFSGSTDAAVGALKGLLPALSVGAIVGFSRQITEASDRIDALRIGAAKVSGSARGFDLLYASAQSLGVSLDDAAQAASNFSTPLSRLGRDYRQTLAFSEDLT
jgi:hypothetical protein